MKSGTTSSNHAAKLELLLNNEDAPSKTKKIIKLLQKHPELYSHLFVLNRTILHVAIMRQLVDLLENIITIHPAIILTPDRSGNYAFHYAERFFVNDAIVQKLSHCAREYINLQDAEGNTALHNAVLGGKMQVVTLLLKAKASMYVRNKKGFTPYDLAKENPHILALFETFLPEYDRVKVSQVFPPLMHRQIQLGEDEDLRRKFSALHLSTTSTPRSTPSSTPRQSEGNTLPSSVLAAIPSPTEINLYEALEKGDIDSIKRYLQEGGDPQKKIFLGRTLLIQAFISACSSKAQATPRLSEAHFQILLLLLQHAPIDGKDNRERTLFDMVETNPQKIALIGKLYHRLAVDYAETIKRNNFILEQMQESLENCLYDAGFQIFDHQQVEWREENYLWNICAGYIDDNKKRRFNKKYVSETIQGMLTTTTPFDIIISLRKYWSEFSLNQKLVAIFILKELLIWDLHHEMATNLIKLQMHLILKHVTEEFPLHGAKLANTLLSILQIKGELAGNMSHSNYVILDKWINSPSASVDPVSFEALIRQTVALASEVQVDKIKQIALIFRSLNLRFYQKVRISEFHDKRWSKEDKHLTAPMIVWHTEVTNKLIEFIQRIILEATTTEACVARLGLFIRVATECCVVSKEGIGPDLCASFYIMAALNSTAILRLKNCFALLSSEDQSKLEALHRLIDVEHMSNQLRVVSQAYVLPIMNIGQKLSDLDKTHENQGLPKLSLLGKAFFETLQLQRDLMPTPCIIESCILKELNDMVSDPNQPYMASSRFCALPIDIMSLEDLTQFVSYMIINKFLGKIKYAGKEYENDSIMNPILMRMHHCIYIDKEASSETSTDTHTEHKIIKARKLVMDFKAFIEAQHPGITISLVNILSLLPDLKKQKNNSTSNEALDTNRGSVIYLASPRASNSEQSPKNRGGTESKSHESSEKSGSFKRH